jgi:basic membrane protein A
MKAMRILALAPVAAIALAGCGGSTGTGGGNSASGSQTSAASGDCSSKDVFCVGLVTDTGKVDDKSFNQAAWEGVKGMSGAQTKYIETTDAKDYAANIKQFTDAKYDVIVTVGFLMADATGAAGKANPDTKFIGVDQDQSKASSNVTGLVFPEDKAGYAVGYLAGLLTKTNKLGAVNGLEIPPVQKYFKGYEAGAKAANPKVSVVGVYHPAADNAFGDPVWGAGEAKKQIAQGVDIIFGIGGGTGNGALGELAKTAGAGTDKFCIGVDLDQYNTLPEAKPCLITSAEKKISEGVTTLLGQAKDGTIKGGAFLGTTGISDFHDLASKVPAEVKTKVDAIVKGLEDGSVKTGVTL